jgi:hypothetical protein
MRTRWLLVSALVALLCAGCSDSGDGFILFRASDPILRSLTIGTVPVKAGEVVNVPLGVTYSVRFDLYNPVTPANVGTTLDYSIRIENIDEGKTTLLSEGVMDENGDLVWLDDTNMAIEFRMTHAMSYVVSGGVIYSLGSPGDKFRVKLDFMSGQAQDGKNFSLIGDEFFVVWTNSGANE